MFSCTNCSSVFPSILMYTDHQKVHRSTATNSIPCLYSNCNSSLKNFISFRKHLLRFHRSHLSYSCKYYGCRYKCSSLLTLEKHKKRHSPIKCTYCEPGKNVAYNFNTYRCHLFKNHKNTTGICKNDTPFSDQISSKPVVSSTSKNIKDIVQSLKWRYCDTFQSNASTLTNTSANQPKIPKLNENVFLQNSTVLDLGSKFVVNELSTIESVKNDNASYTECNQFVKEIVKTKTNDELKIETVSILDRDDDEMFEEIPNSLIVNALNWEVEHYVSCKTNKTEDPDPMKRLAKIYVNLAVKNFATEPVLQGVMDGLYSAFDSCQIQFWESLSSLNIENSDLIRNIFNSSFKSFITSHNPKTGMLRSTHMRKKYYKQQFNYIQSIRVAILDNSECETQYFFSYVPILETIESLLMNDNVRPFCINPRKSSNNNSLFDVKDGNFIKNSNFFNNKNTVQIGFYQDAFELCNPLGASKSKFKMIGIYMILLNLPPFLRSKTENIKLVMLVNNKYVTKFGWKNILQRLISDLHILENEGVNIVINSETMNFKGSIVASIGDNLGNHSIGGFVENFTTFICQYCEITLKEFRENPFNRKPLRTINSYDICTAQAIQSGKPVMGIKMASPLNELEHFHVAGPGLAPCLAHDLYEGIVPFDVYLAIKYFIKIKWIRLGLLNYRLNSIRLSNEGAKFIPHIKMNVQTKKLTGSASQMKRLMLILPLAMYDHIKNHYDPVWEMILLLRKLCCIASAPALNTNQIALLSSVINDYIHLRTTCFKEPLRPKHHFVMHYPELFYIFGPLKHIWTLRFESKHSYFKSIVESLRNFKNIDATLAEKHELLQASLEKQYDIFVESKDATPYLASEYAAEISTLVNDYIANDPTTISYVAKNVNFCHVRYSENMCICVGINTFGNFVICAIKYILINQKFNYIYFIGWTDEIILFKELGVYEKAQYKGSETRSRWLSIFPYSHLLSPDPLPQFDLKTHPIYLMKYVPFDPVV